MLMFATCYYLSLFSHTHKNTCTHIHPHTQFFSPHQNGYVLFSMSVLFWPTSESNNIYNKLVFSNLSVYYTVKPALRWYHTLQGDNSLKTVERFDHRMFVCRFQASRWSKPQREKASEFIALSLLVGIC
jgi:hypothetical protein